MNTPSSKKRENDILLRGLSNLRSKLHYTETLRSALLDAYEASDIQGFPILWDLWKDHIAETHREIDAWWPGVLDSVAAEAVPQPTKSELVEGALGALCKDCERRQAA